MVLTNYNSFVTHPYLQKTKRVVLILLKFDIVDGDISEGKSNKTKQKFLTFSLNLNFIKQKPQALHSVAKYYYITCLKKIS